MKVQQLSLFCLVSLVFSCLVPFLAAEKPDADTAVVPSDTTAGGAAAGKDGNKKGNKKDEAAAAAKVYITKDVVTFTFKEIFDAWNAVNAAKALTGPAGTHKVTLPNLAMGEQETVGAKQFVTMIGAGLKDPELEVLKAELNTLITGTADVSNAALAARFNKSNGYTGKQHIRFEATEKDKVEPVLKAAIQKATPIGLKDIAADKAGFDAALKTVFNDKAMIFQVTVVPEKTNLANFTADVDALVATAIPADADPKHKALKVAIDAYVAKADDPALLEAVKVAMLHVLKGEAPVEEKSGLPTWGWILIIVGVIAVIGGAIGVCYFVFRGKKSSHL